MRPVLKACFKRLLDQETPKAGAIDVEICPNPLAIVEQERVDKPVIAAEFDVDNLAFEARDASRLGKFTQKPRVQAGVEMKGIGHSRKNRSRVVARPRKFAGAGRDRSQRVVCDISLIAGLAQFEPALMKGVRPNIGANSSKRVEIAVSQPTPVPELDAELERRLRLANEFVLVEPEE